MRLLLSPRALALCPCLALLLLLFAVSVVSAAEIHGTVTNADGGEPLSKIQVSISGTSFTAVTAKAIPLLPTVGLALDF